MELCRCFGLWTESQAFFKVRRTLKFRKAWWGRSLGCALHSREKNELARVGGQLLSDLVRYGGIRSFVHHVPFVLAILEFFVRHPRRRRLARGDRCTAHEFIEARIGENERKIDDFTPRVLKADPRFRRDKNNSSSVDVSFLRS